MIEWEQIMKIASLYKTSRNILKGVIQGRCTL